MFYVTKQYSHHAVSSCYETVDGERLGFQMHNIFGQPGRKIEVRVGNASMLDPSNSKKTTLGSSYIPLRVKGVDRNVLIDESGEYLVDDAQGGVRLFGLLSSGSTEFSLLSVTQEKAKRKEFYEKAKRKALIKKC
jgi:hypothetical protein